MSERVFLTDEQIEQIVRETLGTERVRSVYSHRNKNLDHIDIVKVRIIYDAEEGITIDEMESILDAIWLEDAPFPVVDFQEDTDVVNIAAQ